MRRSGRTKKLKIDKDVSPPPPAPSFKNRKGASNKAKPVGGVEREQRKEDESNPAVNVLENPVILHHLFKLCPSKLLANCRLVCKLWYEESLVTWRTNFPLTFTMEGKDNRLFLVNNEEDKPTLRTRLQKFLAYCDDPKNQCSTKPYRNVEINRCEFSLNPDQFQDFWGSMGTNITTLELFRCTFRDVEEFRKIIFNVCPNLQTLGLEQSQFPPTDMASYSEEPLYYGRRDHLRSLTIILSHQTSVLPLPISWLELFSHFQSLARISFDLDTNNPSQYEDEFHHITDAIRTVRKRNPKAFPLKYVDFNEAMDISGWDPTAQKKIAIGQELRLPFDSLRIQAKAGMDESHVKNRLQFHAQTVNGIRLTRASGDPDDMILEEPFPFGVLLNKLAVLGIDEELCEDMSFLKYTPSLKLLLISKETTPQKTDTTIISNSCKVEIMANLRMVHLRQLELINGMTVTDQDIFTLHGWMPNLKILSMRLNDKQFGIVCGLWKCLTSLAALGWDLTDAGVTGMGKLEGMNTRGGGGRHAPNNEAIRPNITNLQNLEEFKFWSEELTDESVFHGFLQLPHLHKIQYFSLNLGWGREAIKALKRKKVELGWGRW